ncbi:MAG: AAA family ATPase [Acidiferrobacter sp.]
MEWLDGGDLLQEQPKPIDWFLEDLLPLGTVGDVFSPPGSGKSTILTTLTQVVAARTWWRRWVCVFRI